MPAEGRKGPDFWRAFEDGEVKVIGKSLQTPIRIRSLQRTFRATESAFAPPSDHVEKRSRALDKPLAVVVTAPLYYVPLVSRLQEK